MKKLAVKKVMQLVKYNILSGDRVKSCSYEVQHTIVKYNILLGDGLTRGMEVLRRYIKTHCDVSKTNMTSYCISFSELKNTIVQPIQFKNVKLVVSHPQEVQTKEQKFKLKNKNVILRQSLPHFHYNQ